MRRRVLRDPIRSGGISGSRVRRPGSIERARFAAEYHGVDVDFGVANYNDVEAVQAITPADIVACLGYFYHATNPALTLQAASNLSNRYDPSTGAFWKSTEYAGLKKLEEIEYDSVSGKTDRGYQWVGGLFSKNGGPPKS